MGLALFLSIYGISYPNNVLSLEDILEIAKVSNPQVKIEKLNTEIKRKDKDKALKNYLLPPVTFSDSDEWSTIKKYGLGAKSLSASIDIFKGGADVNDYKVKKTNLAVAENNEILAELSAQEQAAAAYFAVLNARKQSEITDSATALLAKQRDRTWDLYSNGKLVPKSEYLKIESEIEKSKIINFENRENEINTMGILARILGYPIDAQLVLEDFDSGAYLKKKADIEKRAKKPVEETILGKNEKYTLDIAEYEVKKAKAELYPTITMSFEHNFAERDKEEGWRKVDEDRFELGFSWEFEWGGTLDDIESKKYSYEQAKTAYEDNIKGIALNMRNQLNRVKSLYGQSVVAKKQAELLEENMKLDGMRYENELLSTFDYLNSVNSYREAEENYYRTQRELVLAVIQYENLYR